METFLEMDGSGLKQPYHLKNNVFLIYSPRVFTYQKRQGRLLHQNSEGKKFMKLPKKKGDCGYKYQIRLIVQTCKEKKRHLLDSLLSNQKI